MGSRASKPAQATARKFPTRAPGTVPPLASAAAAAERAAWSPGRTARDGGGGAPVAVAEGDADADADADPGSPGARAFSQRLQRMGVVTPNPTLSHSSTAAPGLRARQGGAGPGPGPVAYPAAGANATLDALEARRRMQRRVDDQQENAAGGREFVDAGTLRQIVLLRDRGAAARDIEERFHLRGGVLAKLGRRGVVTALV